MSAVLELGPRAVHARHLRVRDLVGVASLLSLARVPLAILFVFTTAIEAQIAILACAGATDLADGWYARRYGRVTATGALVDPVTDKIFVAAVVATLVVHGRLPLALVPLLAVRELLELVLLAWGSIRRVTGGAPVRSPAVNVLGKLGTLAQFVCVGLAVVGARPGPLWAAASVAAALGLLAGASYWRAALLRAPPLPLTFVPESRKP